MVHSFIYREYNHKHSSSQILFVTTLWGAVILWLLLVSVQEYSPDIEMRVSIFAVLGVPLNLAPSKNLATGAEPDSLMACAIRLELLPSPVFEFRA